MRAAKVLERPGWGVLFAGAVVNVVILAAPLFLLGRGEAVTSPRITICLLALAAWTILEGRLSAERGSSKTAERWAFLPAAIGGALLATFWVSLVEAAIRGARGWNSLAFVACGLVAIGIVLRLLAIRRLGSFFLDHVALQADHSLVTDGVFGWLRHPSETGLLLVALGSSLLLGSIVGLVFVGSILLPLVLWRVTCEDVLLADAFGVEFTEYRARVGGLLPFPRLLRDGARFGTKIERPAGSRIVPMLDATSEP